MKIFTCCFLSLSCLTMLAGCSDPKAANNDNFQKVLQSHYAQNKPVCISTSGLDKLPLEVGKNSYSVERLDALVAVGLLSKTPETITVVNMFSFGDESKEKQVEGFVYDLTPEGKQYLTIKRSAYSGEKLEFCFGRVSDIKIENFTEPSNAFGYTISSVQYTYKIDDIPQWVQTEGVQAAFPYLARDISRTKGDDELILMGDGWAHQSMVNDR